MKSIHVSTEFKGNAILEVVGHIIADLWLQKDETYWNLEGYKNEGASIEAEHAEGILMGLDLAMDSIINVICPDYFMPKEKVSD